MQDHLGVRVTLEGVASRLKLGTKVDVVVNFAVHNEGPPLPTACAHSRRPATSRTPPPSRAGPRGEPRTLCRPTAKHWECEESPSPRRPGPPPCNPRASR